MLITGVGGYSILARYSAGAAGTPPVELSMFSMIPAVALSAGAQVGLNLNANAAGYTIGAANRSFLSVHRIA
jgi:hypothetical protein